MIVFVQQRRVLVNAPSPPVGEGIAALRPTLAWVRGSLHARAVPIDPLTRLRFAQSPSPTRGEGCTDGLGHTA